MLLASMVIKAQQKGPIFSLLGKYLVVEMMKHFNDVSEEKKNKITVGKKGKSVATASIWLTF